MPFCPPTRWKKSWQRPRQFTELSCAFRLGLHLKERTERFRGYSGLAQDRAQRACVEFRMIRHDDLCEWSRASKNDVAAVLSFDLKSEFAKC